jgi:undecaprenyl-diphosphatase
MYGQAMLFTLFYPKRLLYFMTFASLIGFSRIYTGVHYPGDILGGFIFGTVIAWTIYSLYFTLKRLLFRRKTTQVTTADSNPPIQQ